MNLASLTLLIVGLSVYGISFKSTEKNIPFAVRFPKCHLRLQDESLLYIHQSPSLRFCRVKSNSQAQNRATGSRDSMMDGACSWVSIKSCSQSNGLICDTDLSSPRRTRNGNGSKLRLATSKQQYTNGKNIKQTLPSGHSQRQTTKQSLRFPSRAQDAELKSINQFTVSKSKTVWKSTNQMFLTKSKTVRKSTNQMIVTKSKTLRKSTNQMFVTKSKTGARESHIRNQIPFKPSNDLRRTGSNNNERGRTDNEAELFSFRFLKPTQLILTGEVKDDFTRVRSLTYVSKSEILIFFTTKLYYASKFKGLQPVSRRPTQNTVAVAQQIFFIFFPNRLASMDLYCRNARDVGATKGTPRSMAVDMKNRLIYTVEGSSIMVYTYSGSEFGHMGLQSPEIQLFIEPKGLWLYYAYENMLYRISLKEHREHLQFNTKLAGEINSVCIIREKLYVNTESMCDLFKQKGNNRIKLFIKQDRLSCLCCDILQVCNKNSALFLDTFIWREGG